MYEESDYLLLSGIQHFAFCRRQWALIHLEQAWEENILTAEGRRIHDRAHDSLLKEHRGDLIVVRGLSVSSSELGLSGQCDVVEFQASEKGHPLNGEGGLWLPYPVEYKRGKGVFAGADRVQLCAEAICLEEMFACDIPEGALFHQETRSREVVRFDESLRMEVEGLAKAMHDAFARGSTPKQKSSAACKSCSLKDLCLSQLPRKESASGYTLRYLKGLLE